MGVRQKRDVAELEDLHRLSGQEHHRVGVVRADRGDYELATALTGASPTVVVIVVVATRDDSKCRDERDGNGEKQLQEFRQGPP